MKVIKRVPWSYKFTCATCSSELEAEAPDVMYSNWEDGGEYYTKCGVCEDRHVVDSKKLPHEVAVDAVRFSTAGARKVQ